MIENDASVTPSNIAYLWRRETLTFDLVIPKVDRFMPMTRGPLVPISIKIGLFDL